jgi:Ca2+-binding RTX toxin-like protein
MITYGSISSEILVGSIWPDEIFGYPRTQTSNDGIYGGEGDDFLDGASGNAELDALLGSGGVMILIVCTAMMATIIL